MIFSFSEAFSQSNCIGPKFCAVKQFDYKSIIVACNAINGAYAYRARIKSLGDSVWQYFMVNSPDTLIEIRDLKTTKDYIVQMGIMCSNKLNDTSDFSMPDTLTHYCKCEFPKKIWVESVDSNSAVIKWLPTFDSKKFKLFYSVEKRNIGEWNSIIVDAGFNPRAELKMLQPNTEYEISIRSICIDRNRGISDLSKPFLKFKTK